MTTQQQDARQFSFEFFPPKTEQGAQTLHKVYQQLGQLQPQFCSVTFGAGGSTRDKTFATVIAIKKTGIDAAPHLSCVASTRKNIIEILNNYKNNAITRIVTLRGDLPSGTLSAGEFRYANELVTFIREQTTDHFNIHVAAYPEVHPQAENANQDLKNFKHKVDAGADEAITQYFYNAEAYFSFLDRCEKHGIDIPIIPGIMPIINYSQLSHFSEMCGAEIPRWLRKQLEIFGDDRKSICALGEEVVSNLCQRLLENGVPGLHFYTMNRAEPTLAIWNNLNLSTYI